MVTFSSWIRDNKLRPPVVLGLCNDKRAMELSREV